MASPSAVQALIEYVRNASLPFAGPLYLGSCSACISRVFSGNLSGNAKVSWHDVGILSSSHVQIRGLAVQQPCRHSS